MNKAVSTNNPTRVVEMLLGLLVLVAAAGFTGYAWLTIAASSSSGSLRLTADFSDVGGLAEGAPVTLRGVTVGQVETIAYVADVQMARVGLALDASVRLASDSAAEVTSGGVLGDVGLRLVPGTADDLLASGGVIARTASAASLEDLIGRSLFLIADVAAAPTQDGNP